MFCDLATQVDGPGIQALPQWGPVSPQGHSLGRTLLQPGQEDVGCIELTSHLAPSLKPFSFAGPRRAARAWLLA